MDQPTKKETPIYHGVRQRNWGKWVSEIREPGKKSRIWLGSFDNPEMAARAHDVAAIAIKGSSAILNFPHLTHILPKPASKSPKDIQAAALKAATLVVTSEHSRRSSSRVELEPGEASFEDTFVDLPDLFIDHRRQNDQIFATTLLEMVSSGPDIIGDSELLWPEHYFLWNDYS